MGQKHKKTNQSEEERDFRNWLECVLLKLEDFFEECSHNTERWLMSGKVVIDSTWNNNDYGNYGLSEFFLL